MTSPPSKNCSIFSSGDKVTRNPWEREREFHGKAQPGDGKGGKNFLSTLCSGSVWGELRAIFMGWLSRRFYGVTLVGARPPVAGNLPRKLCPTHTHTIKKGNEKKYREIYLFLVLRTAVRQFSCVPVELWFFYGTIFLGRNVLNNTVVTLNLRRFQKSTVKAMPPLYEINK